MLYHMAECLLGGQAFAASLLLLPDTAEQFTLSQHAIISLSGPLHASA